MRHSEEKEEKVEKGLKELEKELSAKVQDDYARGLLHIRGERERKREIMEKVLDQNLPNGQVRVNLLWRNIQLELALFLTDEIGVKFLSDNEITGEEIMKNANLMAKNDDITMEMRTQRETIVNHNALYGLSVTVIDGWDKDAVQPISDVIDPLSCIFDPQNYSGCKMRFFGIERRLSKEYLESAEGFEIGDDTYFCTSEQLRLNKQSSDSANNLNQILTDDDGMVDVYDEFLSHDGYKWLTTWVNERNTLIRAVKLAPLSIAEKKNPYKVKFPVQLHRRKPKYGAPMGVSIADEILQFQDAISILTNLELIQANNLALGPDIFIDEKLGIDTETLSKRRPGGRIIPVTNDSGLPTQNGVYTQQIPPPSPFVDNMIGKLEQRAEGTTNISQQSFGLSQAGPQTKAEIQTLQQNANQILIWIANNYLQGQKEYWEAHYRAYVEYMKKGDKKRISLFDKWNAYSRSLTKDDFVDDGKVIAYITSKSQDAIENDKEFNKLLALANIYLMNMKKWYGMNDFLRMIGNKSNIRDFDSTRFINESIDELDAKKNLQLLNLNIDVPGPKDGQDYMTYILVYRQALDTPAKEKALRMFEEAYLTIQSPEEEAKALQERILGGSNWAGDVAMWNPQTANTALNNLNQGVAISTGITKN